PTRSRAVRDGGPDWLASLGAHWTALRRRPSGRWATCQLSVGERTEATGHATHGVRGRGAAHLALRTWRSSERHTVHHAHGEDAQSRCTRAPARHARRNGRQRLSVSAG